MRIFVCEFITGGGLYRAPLANALMQEGVLMRDALLRDLAVLPGISISTTCDSRLSLPELASQCQVVSPSEDVWQVWQHCIAQADAVWLVAPESDGVLTRLTQMVELQGKLLLGSNSTAVALATDKLACSSWLQQHGVQVIASYKAADWLRQRPETMHGWVAKRNDGAGCEDSGYFSEEAVLQDWLQSRQHSHIVQPYQPGIPASLSLLCHAGQAWLLSCNRQLIQRQQQQFSYHGSLLNGMAAHWVAGAAMATAVAHAIPGLAAYVGVDVIIAEDGNLHLLEVNPRLTTSYAGLRAALGYNPAQLVLDLLHYNRPHFELPALARHAVTVALKAE